MKKPYGHKQLDFYHCFYNGMDNINSFFMDKDKYQNKRNGNAYRK